MQKMSNNRAKIIKTKTTTSKIFGFKNFVMFSWLKLSKLKEFKDELILLKNEAKRFSVVEVITVVDETKPELCFFLYM